jgi:hypothetical protein
LRLPRVLILLIALAAVSAALVSGAPGAMQIVLFAGPFLLIAGLLLSGRYVGEERIHALRAARAPRRLRAARRVGRPHGRELALASLLERAAWSLRGPPALTLA